MKYFAHIVALMLLVAIDSWAEGVTRMSHVVPVADYEGRIPLDGRPKSITGTMKIPVILVDFKDQKFSEEHDLSYYENLFNKEKYDEPPFYGSVHDYFLDQSNGQLDVSFDIFGVFTVDTNQKDCFSFKGQLDYVFLEKVRSIIDEKLNEVDFDSYDWNNDGYVDAIGIITAGKGGGETYFFGKTLVKGDVTISEYFHASEFSPLAGSAFGVICHEFSHCLGLPDLYTASGKGVLEKYDLMDYGNYNGDGYRPAGYSAYEKWLCGWQTPIEITKDTVINALKPQSENGDAFWIVNPNNPNEAFFIENRQKTRWDSFIPEGGLMITHLNYDSTVWFAMYPSSNYLESKIGVYYVMANGTNDALQPGVLYPYNGNDSLTAYSLPDWQWVVGSDVGKNLVNGALVDIRQNEDGSISFKFKARDNSNVKPNEFDVAVGGLWYRVNRKMQSAILIKSKGETYSGKVTIPLQISFDDEIFEVSSIQDSAFYRSKVTDVVISEGVIRIVHAMFMEADNLESVEIPSSVVTIDSFAFYGASAFTKVNIPEGIQVIDRYAFACSGIENLSLPSTLVSIGEMSFGELSVTSFEIPANVEKMETLAFGIGKLDTVTVKNSTPIEMTTTCIFDVCSLTAFGYADSLSHTLLRVPKGSLEVYKNADVWKLFGTIEEYETDSSEEHTTVLARQVPRYDLKMGRRLYDLQGRKIEGRPRHKGLFVKR